MTPFGREPMGDVFFDRLWPEWHRDMGEEWTPSVNFFEKEGKYLLNAELPGLSKDDISVNVDGGVLTITGKKEDSQEEEGASYYIKESRSGSFRRSFKIPGEIDENRVEASFKDGVLKLVMPRKEATTTRKIEIK